MNLENFPVFEYTDDDFVFSNGSRSKSQFDEKLIDQWEKKMLNNCFRYKLENLRTKYLPGKYQFVAQLNIKRAVERRKPQFISSIVMPFNPEIFHFGKVSEKEILFTLKPQHWEKNNILNKDQSHHVLVINVSPIEECHSLLIPNIEKCSPQVLTMTGLRLAVETMLISSDKFIRMGFNSLGAYASVNHLHFHLYYFNHNLPIETTSVKQLIGHCYELESYPADGFAFQIKDATKVLEVVELAIKLVNFLIQKEIPHNIFITKGKPFGNEESSDLQNTSIIRIFIWARKAIYGSKYDISFNAAVCELAGHIIVKEAEGFDSITEDYVSEVLKDACHATFSSIREEIKALYS